jgi:hypothetical protein
MKVAELLLEAKSVRDWRHENVEKEFPYWGAVKLSGWIDPAEGMYFLYHGGQLILASTVNEVYSGIVASGEWKAVVARKKKVQDVKLERPGETDLWNHLGGKIVFADKTITIAKEDAGGKSRMRTINDIKTFKDALKNLKRYKVTDDFVIKGIQPGMNGKTVGEVLAMEDNVTKIMKNKPQVLYHGTSWSRWESIQKKGLQPGHTGEVYNDLIKGYSEHNVYLGMNPKTAEFYGKRQAVKDGDDKYVVLEITVPDPGKYSPDDAFHPRREVDPKRMHNQVKLGVKELGSVAYRGTILPKHIKLFATKKA